MVTRSDDPLAPAAARVLGADVLAPCTLLGQTASEADIALLGTAARAFPPAAGSSSSEWNHWGLLGALRLTGATAGTAAGTGAEPAASWVTADPWPRVTHRLAQVAALAGLPLPSELSAAAGGRVVDVARGFVRAVRRRDWFQAAGAGRWLATMDDVPPSLGLDRGLAFVAQMGGDDARVALHVQVAQALLVGTAGATRPAVR
ncbi:hypothetical protein [Streptomyces sp. MST-110588]|uniref:hypothetical protein n=1 Tax=Streptomyces sp. MST-110588 TaxID=2833628 RepID=UPI001F5CEE23|nr:hypothetical protein [Streptomyces sp. MST-110588]